jgi:hypothetical protein
LKEGIFTRDNDFIDALSPEILTKRRKEDKKKLKKEKKERKKKRIKEK